MCAPEHDFKPPDPARQRRLGGVERLCAARDATVLEDGYKLEEVTGVDLIEICNVSLNPLSSFISLLLPLPCSICG
jgi:hypothetical protein